MAHANLCPKALQPRKSVRHRQCPQDLSSSVPTSTLSNAGKLSSPYPHTHTHAPCPGCTSIHSYCRQQPGPHPISRENVRQSQFSVLLRDTEPCLWVIYLQGQGDQLLSTNELFHFQWGQRRNTLRTPPTLNHNVRRRTSSFCPESWSLVAPVIPLLPQTSQGSAPPWSSFLPQSSATTLFITIYHPDVSAQWIIYLDSTEQKLIALESGTLLSRNISAALLTCVTPRTVPAIRALHSSPASALGCSLSPPTSHRSLQLTLLIQTRLQVHIRSHQPSSLWGSCERCHVSPLPLEWGGGHEMKQLSCGCAGRETVPWMCWEKPPANRV